MVGVGMLAVLMISVAIVLGLVLSDNNDDSGYRFKKAAVAADNEICSETGR